MATRSSRIARSTPYDLLPAWLGRKDVCKFLGISLASADGIIHRYPHRFFGKHLRIAKHFFAPSGPPIKPGRKRRVRPYTRGAR